LAQQYLSTRIGSCPKAGLFGQVYMLTEGITKKDGDTDAISGTIYKKLPKPIVGLLKGRRTKGGVSNFDAKTEGNLYGWTTFSHAHIGAQIPLLGPCITADKIIFLPQRYEKRCLRII